MSQRQRKPSTLLFFIIVLILITGAALIFGFFAIRQWVTLQFGQPATGLSMVQRVFYPVELFIHREKLITSQMTSDEEVRFSISQGESVSLVCLRLEREGLISDAEILRTFLVYTGMDRNLQSGIFNLSAAMTPIQVANTFLNATPAETVVSVLAGWRIEEVAANVESSGLPITAELFTAQAYAPPSEYIALLPASDIITLEGYLFPGTYVLSREAPIEAVFEALLSAFTEQVDQTILDGFTRQGLTINEAVTLASIVEKEAVVDDEKPMIASVFYNRIAQGMRLETDPTVQYALGLNLETNSWWKAPLALADLAINSPYNTYLVAGLPPTPICNPRLDSLRAVAFPAETPYFFFRSACDGSGRHNFAITFEEHVNNSCE